MDKHGQAVPILRAEQRHLPHDIGLRHVGSELTMYSLGDDETEVVGCEDAARQLPDLFAAGRGVRGWSDHAALAQELLGDDAARIVDALKAATRAGAAPADKQPPPHR